jgi:hypothetical protein
MHWLTVFIIIVLAQIPLEASAKIGEVIQQVGNSTIERTTGNKLKADKGTGVESMDIVKTGTSKTSIQFVDETRVDVTENSKLVIDEFVYDPNTNTGKLALKTSFGTVRYASGQIAKNSRQDVKISTPTASVGVRGTDFTLTVDETGSSTIILLPSCTEVPKPGGGVDRFCLVGEIEVSSDIGTVILNQAFQATVVETAKSNPFKPIILDIDEKTIGNMLIIRRPVEISAEDEKRRAEKLADFLGFDFLEFQGLNQDFLAAQTKDLWMTELDIDFLDQDFLADVLDLLNAALTRAMGNVLDTKEGITLGRDPETQIELYDIKPSWLVKRNDGLGNNFELRLDQNNGYNVNMKQGDFEYRDYRLGDGTNEIDIKQTQQ